MKQNLICTYERLYRPVAEGLQLFFRKFWEYTKTWWISAQCPFWKYIFGTSCQKLCKSRYQNFPALSIVTGCFYFAPNIVSGIVGYLEGTCLFWYFLKYCKKHIYEVSLKLLKFSFMKFSEKVHFRSPVASCFFY